MEAFGIRAPVESVTLPAIAPRTDCATATVAAITNTRRTTRHGTANLLRFFDIEALLKTCNIGAFVALLKPVT
jgi:hypothetical protein